MARRQGAPKPSRGSSGRASSGRGGKGLQRSQGYQGKRQQDGRSQGRFGRPQQGAPRPAGRGDARRGGSKGDLIEGRRAVSEALDLGLPVMRALIQKDSGNADPALTELARRLAADGVEVERVAKPILDSLSSHGAHQGVMLRVRPYRYASLRDVIDAAGEGNALVIVLDHVTDEGNFGAIVRTAEVVGAAGVIIANKRAAGVTVGSYKTSAGAVMHLPIAQVPNIARALDDLKAAGFWVGGASEHAEGSCWDAPFEGRVALVMGSEGDGISRLVLEKCDFLTKLPQRGMTESLNVAQATTALCFEWLRRNAGELMGEE